jgi:hypothetical protein
MNRYALKGGSVAPPFLTSALHGCEWSASRPCRFTPRGAPQTLSGRYGGEKKIAPAGKQTPAYQRVAPHYAIWVKYTMQLRQSTASGYLYLSHLMNKI